MRTEAECTDIETATALVAGVGADVYPHPHPINASKWEWLTTREVKVRLLERPAIREAEHLTEADIAELRRKQQAAGAETFKA